MFVPAVRLALILSALVLAFLSFGQAPVVGWLLLLAALLLLFGHWRYGTVWVAWRAYRLGDLDAMERRLAGTPNPKYLQPQQRAHYNFLLGVAHRRHGRLPEARQHFERAACGRLRSSNTRSLCYVQLAEAALEAKDLVSARQAIAEARALRPSRFIEALICDLEHNLPAA